jgi:Transposase DDE domain group 1
VLDLALAQIPPAYIESSEILVRADSAGTTHGVIDYCREGNLRFSVGYELTESVRSAILTIPENAWVLALDQDGSARTNGEVCEITDHVDLSAWGEGSRLIVRRERPHPGAQLSFTDHDGYRFQAILTDQLEGVLRQAAATHEELKIPFLAHLFARVAHDETISGASALFLLRKAEPLTFRQMKALALAAAREKGRRTGEDRFFKPQIDAMLTSETSRVDAVLQGEIAALVDAGLLTTRAKQEPYTLSALGRVLVNTMELTAIPDTELLSLVTNSGVRL